MLFESAISMSGGIEPVYVVPGINLKSIHANASLERRSKMKAKKMPSGPGREG
jgi:hypothetical protein